MPLPQQIIGSFPAFRQILGTSPIHSSLKFSRSRSLEHHLRPRTLQHQIGPKLQQFIPNHLLLSSPLHLRESLRWSEPPLLWENATIHLQSWYNSRTPTSHLSLIRSKSISRQISAYFGTREKQAEGRAWRAEQFTTNQHFAYGFGETCGKAPRTEILTKRPINIEEHCCRLRNRARLAQLRSLPLWRGVPGGNQTLRLLMLVCSHTRKTWNRPKNQIAIFSWIVCLFHGRHPITTNCGNLVLHSQSQTTQKHQQSDKEGYN